MRPYALIFLATLLASCAVPTQKRPRPERLQPEFDRGMALVDVNGFKLGMTPRAVLAVIRAKGYREGYSNRATLEDLAVDGRKDYSFIEVYEFSHGERPEERVFQKTGVFNLSFSNGRIQSLAYELTNISKQELDVIRERNALWLNLATERSTNTLSAPHNGTATFWKYSPNKLAFWGANFVEREPRRNLGSCNYSVTAFDGNNNLVK